MEWIHNIEEMQETCIAFGSFEGMHKGHLLVLEKVVAEGKKRRQKSVIVSCFSKKDTKGRQVLTTEEEKAYFLGKSDLDIFISYDEDENFLQPEAFIRSVLIGTLGAKTIIAGAMNENLAMLQGICREEGIELIIVEAATYEGRIITDGMIREAFMGCRFEDVTAMCGHAYVMIGQVEHGKALGRTVGMPTANLGVPGNKLMPPSGVYATLTDVDGVTYKGLTNIGTRPSVDDMSYITIETFLLDFSKDIYGKKLVMEVHLYIRGVQKFGSLDEVQKQVQKDLAQVRGYLDTTKSA